MIDVQFSLIGCHQLIIKPKELLGKSEDSVNMLKQLITKTNT